MLFHPMKKPALLFLLLLVNMGLLGQNNNGKNPRSMELQFGTVQYNYINQIMPSLQLAYVMHDDHHFSGALFINGYTTLQSITKRTSLNREFAHRPMGFRGGLNLRISTNSQKTHGFIELQGSLGRAYQTGITANSMNDKAWESLAISNLGCNFRLSSANYFGFYAGGGIGFLNYKQLQTRRDILRYQAGITYQARF
tara:strand:- start:156 stop:746 length:591 start_codon:yes stop_codon:yes gene_type:complete